MSIEIFRAVVSAMGTSLDPVREHQIYADVCRAIEGNRINYWPKLPKLQHLVCLEAMGTGRQRSQQVIAAEIGVTVRQLRRIQRGC